MKTKYLKVKNWLYTAIGGILGLNLSGCNGSSPFGIDEPVCEYGTPVATYQVKGRVTDMNDNPIKNITVEMNYSSTKTMSDGTYEIMSEAFPHTEEFEMFFRDEDGDTNGSYADTTVNVSFKDLPYTGGDGNWNSGVVKTTKDVKLRNK